jgi:hypothetical protein
MLSYTSRQALQEALEERSGGRGPTAGDPGTAWLIGSTPLIALPEARWSIREC